MLFSCCPISLLKLLAPILLIFFSLFFSSIFVLDETKKRPKQKSFKISAFCCAAPKLKGIQKTSLEGRPQERTRREGKKKWGKRKKKPRPGERSQITKLRSIAPTIEKEGGPRKDRYLMNKHRLARGKPQPTNGKVPKRTGDAATPSPLHATSTSDPLRWLNCWVGLEKK